MVAWWTANASHVGLVAIALSLLIAALGFFLRANYYTRPAKAVLLTAAGAALLSTVCYATIMHSGSEGAFLLAAVYVMFALMRKKPV